MQLINKTQAQLDIQSLENKVAKAVLSLKSAAMQLNYAYNSVWSLPDDRLQALLQALVDANKFDEIFTLHAQSAASINALLVAAGEKAVAKEGAGREYTITGGMVTIIPIIDPAPANPPVDN